jgi:hypothetical protein
MTAHDDDAPAREDLRLAGVASGRTMRQKTWPAEAPSMSAASSSSLGMVSK